MISWHDEDLGAVIDYLVPLGACRTGTGTSSLAVSEILTNGPDGFEAAGYIWELPPEGACWDVLGHRKESRIIVRVRAAIERCPSGDWIYDSCKRLTFCADRLEDVDAECRRRIAEFRAEQEAAA
ncbi:MAG: hypothetical protein AAF604_04800 [Acidobacteriota bacterium]